MVMIKEEQIKAERTFSSVRALVVEQNQD